MCQLGYIQLQWTLNEVGQEIQNSKLWGPNQQPESGNFQPKMSYIVPYLRSQKFWPRINWWQNLIEDSSRVLGFCSLYLKLCETQQECSVRLSTFVQLEVPNSPRLHTLDHLNCQCHRLYGSIDHSSEKLSWKNLAIKVWSKKFSGLRCWRWVSGQRDRWIWSSVLLTGC